MLCTFGPKFVKLILNRHYLDVNGFILKLVK